MILSANFLNAQSGYGRGENQFVDISKKQLRLLREVGDLPNNQRGKMLLDSLYIPFSSLWKGYWPDSDAFISWIEETGLSKIEEYGSRSVKIDRIKLEEYWTQTLESVVELTGYAPKGGCYLYFGPGTLKWYSPDSKHVFIDLSRPEHFNAAAISELFPHYISKLIFAEQQQSIADLAYRLLDGGLACFATYQFHQGAISKAEALGYDTEAYDYCVREEETLFRLLPKLLQQDANHSLSEADSDITEETNRLYDIIGYYLGLRMVEAYTDQFGKDAWRELYSMKPADAIAKIALLPQQ